MRWILAASLILVVATAQAEPGRARALRNAGIALGALGTFATLLGTALAFGGTLATVGTGSCLEWCSGQQSQQRPISSTVWTGGALLLGGVLLQIAGTPLWVSGSTSLHATSTSFAIRF